MTASSQTTLPEMLAALRGSRISIEDLLARLQARGVVSQAAHAAELRILDQALASRVIDARVHRILTDRLAALQNPGATDDSTQIKATDATRINPESVTTAYNPGPGDRTTINPASERTTLNPDSAHTTLNPAAPAPEPVDFDLSGEQPEAGGDATQVTGNKGGKDDGATHFAATQITGSRSGPFTGTGSRTGNTGATGGTSSPGTSSWKRVAERASHEPDREVYAGDVLKQRFVLEKELGRGGMGVVFKATDERKVEAQDRNPHVAVKILNAEFRKHPQALISLQRESRKAQQLTHDNILRVFDFDKDGTIVYMTMEYVDGGTLKDFIKKHPTGMPHPAAWPVIEGLARGLARAHRDGIVHSDFKPGNVMIGSDRIPKIFDLGIARAARAGGQSSGETTVFDAGDLGALTPAYASLEMLKGESPEIPDDIYALAITTYELLTGKHPYAKKNAEIAQKEGLKPARIPGLTRRQWRTLEKGLAFERKDRLQTAEALIDGLRPRTMKDHALPIAIGVGSLALLLAVVPFALRKIEDSRINSTIGRFEQASFATPEDAFADLEKFDGTTRETALQRGAAPIQDYFFKLANQKWDPVAKKYDYPAAFALISKVDALYRSDSAKVSKYLERIDDEKKAEIARLKGEYDQRLEDRRLYEGENNLADVLGIVRTIDPKDDMLAANSAATTRYVDNVKALLRSGDVADAEKRLATALGLFPQSEGLRALQAGIKAQRETELAAARQQEQSSRFAAMTPEQVRGELGKLIGTPKFTPDWQGEVDAAMTALARDAAPESAQLRDQLAEAYASQAARDIDSKNYLVAQVSIDRGLKVAPGQARLIQEKGRLDEMMKILEREQASKTASAEVDNIKGTLKTLAEANDTRGAEAKLAQLKKMIPGGDAFVLNDGPRMIGEAYLRQAQRMAGQKRFDEAMKFVNAGLRAAPMVDGLKQAQAEYRVEGSVMALTVAAGDPAQAVGDELREVAAGLAKADAKRHEKVMAEVAGTVVRKIEALVATDPASAKLAQTEWRKVLGDTAELMAIEFPENIASIAPATIKRPRARRQRPAVDPCQADFAGYGSSQRATCADAMASGTGPKMVVVPGVGGGSPFAITKYEIAIKQFNDFCRSSGKCKVEGGTETFPKTGMNYALAQAYADWLSFETGFDYRLPTEAEWQHAATAGGAGAGEDFNCELRQGAQTIKGGVPIPVISGRPNPWGLLNAVGNAAEWVQGSVARGASFNVPISRCTPDWRESGSGGSGTIGLRVARDLG